MSIPRPFQIASPLALGRLMSCAGVGPATRRQARDPELFYQILAGGGDRCAMPAYGPDSDIGWSELKIWHMLAYIRRFADPDAE
jgi:hypothetical protein